MQCTGVVGVAETGAPIDHNHCSRCSGRLLWVYHASTGLGEGRCHRCHQDAWVEAVVSIGPNMLQVHECGAPVDVEIPIRVHVEGRCDIQGGHTLQDFAAAARRALHGFLSSLVTGHSCAEDP